MVCLYYIMIIIMLEIHHSDREPSIYSGRTPFWSGTHYLILAHDGQEGPVWGDSVYSGSPSRCCATDWHSGGLRWSCDLAGAVVHGTAA